MSRLVFLSIAIVLSLLPVGALRGLINSRRHAGTATASCRAMISHRITAFQLTPRKLRFRAWRAATGALGISIQSQVITGTMATGTISAGLLLRWSLQWRQLWPLLDADADRADLELRLIKLLLAEQPVGSRCQMDRCACGGRMLGRKSNQGRVDPVGEGHLHGAGAAHDRQK